MGYSYTEPSTTSAHTHSATAGDGGALSMSATLRGTGSFLATEMALT